MDTTQKLFLTFNVFPDCFFTHLLIQHLQDTHFDQGLMLDKKITGFNVLFRASEIPFPTTEHVWNSRKSWDKLPTSTGEFTGYLNHQQYHRKFWMRGPYLCIRMNIECLKMFGSTLNKRLWVYPLALNCYLHGWGFFEIKDLNFKELPFKRRFVEDVCFPLNFLLPYKFWDHLDFFKVSSFERMTPSNRWPVTLAIDGWTDLMKIGRLVLDDLQCLRWKFSLQIAICMKRSTRIAPNLVAPVFPKDGWVSYDVWKTSKLQPSTGTHLIHHQQYGS